jgi:hypothetical protein
VVTEVLAWATPLLDKGPVLVYSTAEAGAVKSVQGQLGVEEAGAMVERTIASSIARGLVERGVHQLVVAGGETSGACVQALGIAQMQIGPQIDPGVPWCHARSDAAPEAGLHIALKSGNFGSDDFFTKAFAVLGMTFAGFRGAISRRRGTLAPRMSPACGLLLYFAAQGTPSTRSLSAAVVDRPRPDACQVNRASGAPRSEIKEERSGGHSRRGVPGGLCTRPEQQLPNKERKDRRNDRNRSPRRNLPSRPQPVRARLRARNGREHQRAAGRRLPHHADRCMPRFSRPRAPGKARRARPADRRRPRQQDHRPAHAHLRGSAQVRREHACVIHTHSTHCVALTLTLNTPQEDLLPALTPYFVMKVGHVPVIAYHRPGAPEAAEQVAQAIERSGNSGTPIRAVMLARLGPNVWHDTPAAAMSVLEELEETARLQMLTQTARPAPLDADQIDELRRTFGARW